MYLYLRFIIYDLRYYILFFFELFCTRTDPLCVLIETNAPVLLCDVKSLMETRVRV